MSKLADAIRRSQRVEAAPMGFGAARTAPRPLLLVGTNVAMATVGEAKTAGADVILVEANSLTPDDVKKAREAAGDAVLGAKTAVSTSEEAKALREAGLDFLLVEAETTAAAALLDDDLGYALALPEQPEELFLRSLDSLNLEALYLASTPSPLTVAGQIELGRVAGLGRKPLLSRVAAGASKDDLQCLRAAGVVAVITDVAGLGQLKETVASLPPRRNKREDRAVVSLPRGNVTPEADDDDDDD
ncbi:MAG TPA: hypothetical protein VFX19_00125 [Dehalococcoidia bacterium]|nr:hypothetical protein [Dehalococcoidia bacterium]